MNNLYNKTRHVLKTLIILCIIIKIFCTIPRIAEKLKRIIAFQNSLFNFIKLKITIDGAKYNKIRTIYKRITGSKESNFH